MERVSLMECLVQSVDLQCTAMVNPRAHIYRPIYNAAQSEQIKDVISSATVKR